MQVFWDTLPWVLAVKFIVFLIAGQYDGWWTYVTFGDLIALVRYSLAATFFFAAGQYFLGLGFYIPRSVIVMDCLGSIAVLGGLARHLAAVPRAVLADPQSQRLPLGPAGGHRPRHGPAGQPDPELSRIALSRPRPAGHGRRRRRLAAGADADPGPAGRRSRSRRRLCRQHGAGHGGHPGRSAPAEPDGRLQAIGAGTEDHPSHPGPPGRRPPHPHPRHRNQRPSPPRAGAVGHEHHRPPDRRPHRDGHRAPAAASARKSAGNCSASIRACCCWSGGARTASSRSSASCGRSTPAPHCNPASPTSRTRPACGNSSRSSIPRSSSTPPRTSTCR